MPIFEYLCGRCGEQFEALILRADDKALCPKCGCDQARKLASGFAVGGGGPGLDEPGMASSGCGGGGFS